MLDKKDRKFIQTIVQNSEKRLDKKIDSVDKRVDSVDKKIDSVDKRVDLLDKKIDLVDNKIDSVKKEIISVISHEITDLADINRAVITRTDELDYRLRIVERKLGLSSR